MTHRSLGLLCAAALCAALFLQGCDVPGFVFSQCEAALEPTLGQASSNGLQTAEGKCGTKYQAMSQQNLCIAQGQALLDLSKQRVLPKYVKQCSDFVLQKVCVEGSGCYKKHDKITVAQSATALVTYLQANQAAIIAAMRNDLTTKIDDVVNEKYDQQLKNRAVPAVIKGQCSSKLQMQLGVFDPVTQQSNVMAAPTQALETACSGSQRSASWVATCQDNGLKNMFANKLAMEAQFVKECGKSVLDQACQSGSLCAIDTSLANTLQTEAFAQSYINLNYAAWFTNLKTKLTSDANEARGRLLAEPPTSRLFGVIAIPTQNVKTGLTVGAASTALVGGVGLLGVAMAAGRTLRKRFTRSVNLQTEVAEEELLVNA